LNLDKSIELQRARLFDCKVVCAECCHHVYHSFEIGEWGEFLRELLIKVREEPRAA